MNNLTGVELVQMTSPVSDHQANGLAEVGVREIKAETRILRSQLEQRLGSRIDEKDPLMSWIPRHAANCVSRYKIMDDGRTPDQRRCGKTWKRPRGGVLQVSALHTKLVRTMQCEAETRGCCAVFMWDITRDPVPQFFLTPDGMKRATRVARMLEHERWDRVFSVTCIGVPGQLRRDQRNLVRLVVPEAEADQGVAPVIVMPAVPKTDRRRYVTKRDIVKCGIHRRMPGMHAVGRQACTMRRFLMTTDAEIALASSWQRTMTREKLSPSDVTNSFNL